MNHLITAECGQKSAKNAENGRFLSILGHFDPGGPKIAKSAYSGSAPSTHVQMHGF